MLSFSIPIALITCEFRASNSAAASASAACSPAWPRRSVVALVDHRNQRQGEAGYKGNVFEISVNEKYNSEVEGREARP